MSYPLPPGTSSWSDIFAIFTDPYQFGKNRFERYGPVSRMSLAGKNVALLLGEDAQRYVLTTNYRNFLWREGFKTSIPFFGDAITMVDGDVHDRQRRLMTPAFHGRHMPTYLTVMNRVISEKLNTLAAGTYATVPIIREIAFRLSASLLVGLEVGEQYKQLNDLWRVVGGGVTAPLRMNLPFTRYGMALRATRKLNPFLRDLIRSKRGTESADAAGLLINARDESGDAFTEDELVDQIKFLIAAGYDTTASTTSWLLANLLQRPEALQRVQEEVGADKADIDLDLDDIRQKPFLDAAIKETLRLYPQSFLMPRGVAETFTWEGYTIPAGWLIMLVPAYTQRMPAYFTNPDEFEPERFMPPRQEDDKHPFAWVGFGGGPRICIGSGIAQIEVKAILTRLLRRFDLKLFPGQDLTPRYMPVPLPKGELQLAFTPKA